jgi:hypothetical protein
MVDLAITARYAGRDVAVDLDLRVRRLEGHYGKKWIKCFETSMDMEFSMGRPGCLGLFVN